MIREYYLSTLYTAAPDLTLALPREATLYTPFIFSICFFLFAIPPTPFPRKGGCFAPLIKFAENLQSRPKIQKLVPDLRHRYDRGLRTV